MTQIRPTVKRSEWSIPKHAFYTAYHFAMQYDDWKNMIEAEASLNAVVSDGMPHASGISDPTYTKAVKISRYRDNVRLIEQTVRDVGPDIYCWLLRGVTKENCTYNYLDQMMNIPCGKNYYYDRRRKFYFLLSERLTAIQEEKSNNCN